MTVGVVWLDSSNHDRNRYGGPLPMAEIRAARCSAIITKWSEGTWRDPWALEILNGARAAGFPIIGVYHVVWPGQANQGTWLRNSIAAEAPWLLDHPGRVVMADVEPFAEMPRAPTFAEGKAFLDAARAAFDLAPSRCWGYFPWWAYGSSIASLGYPWVQSSYGTNAGGAAWPSRPTSDDPRWGAHAPTVPHGLQYGSLLSWGSLHGADANAAQFTDEAEFIAYVTGQGDPGMSAEDVTAVNDHTDAMLKLLWGAIGGTDNSVFAGGTTAKDAQAAIFQRLDYLWKALTGQDNSVYSGGTTAKDVADMVAALPTVDAIADEIMDRLGSGEGGQLTKADVRDVVRDVLTGTFLTPAAEAPPPPPPA